LRSFDLPLLYLVTDRHRCVGRPLEDVVAAAVDGGVGAVQLREKDLADVELIRLARRLREVTEGRALFFVNDRADIAVAVGADGIHLPEESLLAAVRRIGQRKTVIGRSVHSAEAGVAAEAEGADLLIAGTVFQSSSHPDREPQGISLLKELGERVKVPCLAIGGIAEENVGKVIEAGVSGAAVITAITESRNPARAANRLTDAMREAWFLRNNAVRVSLA